MQDDFEERMIKWLGIGLACLFVLAGVGAMIEIAIKSWERVQIARACGACESRVANKLGSRGEK